MNLIFNVLGIVYGVIATHLIKQAGFTKKRAQTGAATLIQRFGSALNLNIHFHMLFLDGVYLNRSDGTRFHGVFAPNSKHRALVTPSKRGKGNSARASDEPPTPAERRASMTWAQRLKRVFNLAIETCQACGGAVKVMACIEEPAVIKQILDHLKHKAETGGPRVLPESRAPPVGLPHGLFD